MQIGNKKKWFLFADNSDVHRRLQESTKKLQEISKAILQGTRSEHKINEKCIFLIQVRLLKSYRKGKRTRISKVIMKEKNQM